MGNKEFVDCPFCHKMAFNPIGLKSHIVLAECLIANKLPIQRRGSAYFDDAQLEKWANSGNGQRPKLAKEVLRLRSELCLAERQLTNSGEAL